MQRATSFGLIVGVLLLVGAAATTRGQDSAKTDVDGNIAERLQARFTTQVRPLLERYCHSCHGKRQPEAMLDLSRDATVAAVVVNHRHWETALSRLTVKEMPPEDAPRQPTDAERSVLRTWIRDVLNFEAERTAGDPGIVLARRLSNAEFDTTIRDLTGVDIRPTKEFPVDPANEAGFDNSGESLAMSPALLRKYLAAARHIADHVVLKPDGLVFAPHPVVTDTDRDKYCVQRIMDFYKRHQVDLAEYFRAAWRYHQAQYLHRALGQPEMKLGRFATEGGLSERYLQMIWSALTEPEVERGPLAAVRQLWRELPSGPDQVAKSDPPGIERLRDLVVQMRKQLKPNLKKPAVSGISAGSQTMVLWNNRQLALHHRQYVGDVAADLKKLAAVKGLDPTLTKHFEVPDDEAARAALRKSLERFCTVFPDAFVVSDRGPYFDPNAAGKGRPLTAGFHLMQGFFRDDQPLCDLVLNEKDRAELDALWHELNFIALAPLRQYRDFIFFERAEPPRYMFEAEFDFARSEDKDSSAPAKLERLAKLYLAKAKKRGAVDDAIQAIESYFATIGKEIREVERTRLDAEPSHLQALLRFTERAYRRPLTKAESDEVLAFYQRLRQKDDLNHEDALRDTIASVLLSPQFCYRLNHATAPKNAATRSALLSSYELASRLSYFLWSSMPDEALLSHATAGDLHRPEILKAETRRMLRDPKVRGLATEFAGNWLDIRRFEEHNAVDRRRFPSFTNELRQAMFEEPIRYFMDIVQRDRSVLDLLYGKDTFVNPVLARHYGMPYGNSPRPLGERGRGEGPTDDWIHFTDADRYGRGGLLPMAAFLTKNAPGLRTSPVKRGYWVVRRVLGEQIPPPPPTVPELPKDEAKLGELTLPQLLTRHRADKSCAGCHNRFDAIGLVFEDFGPVGERRTKDLGGRPVATVANFPDGKDRNGLPGLRAYLRDSRQSDFVDNLCKKLLIYALGRGLQLSDTRTLQAMKRALAEHEHSFGSLVEVIVTSPQFLNKRDGEVVKN